MSVCFAEQLFTFLFFWKNKIFDSMQCNMKKIDLALWICRIPYDTTGWMSGLDRIVLIFIKINDPTGEKLHPTSAPPGGRGAMVGVFNFISCTTVAGPLSLGNFIFLGRTRLDTVTSLFYFYSNKTGNKTNNLSSSDR
jgi:hypothetical protein